MRKRKKEDVSEMDVFLSEKLEKWIKWFIKFEIAVIIVKVVLVFLVLYVLHLPLRQNNILVLELFFYPIDVDIRKISFSDCDN